MNPAEKQTLLDASRSVYDRWQAGKVTAPLDSTTLERLSYVFRIHAAPKVLLPFPERAHAWPRQPNASPLFGGSTGLAHMLGGRVGDLKDVADFLETQCGAGLPDETSAGS